MSFSFWIENFVNRLTLSILKHFFIIGELKKSIIRIRVYQKRIAGCTIVGEAFLKTGIFQSLDSTSIQKTLKICPAILSPNNNSSNNNNHNFNNKTSPSNTVICFWFYKLWIIMGFTKIKKIKKNLTYYLS